MAKLEVTATYGNAMIVDLAKMDAEQIRREGRCVEVLRQISKDARAAINKDIG